MVTSDPAGTLATVDIFDKLQQDDHATAASMLITVDEEVEKYLPVIKSECQRMEESSK